MSDYQNLRDVVAEWPNPLNSPLVTAVREEARAALAEIERLRADNALLAAVAEDAVAGLRYIHETAVNPNDKRDESMYRRFYFNGVGWDRVFKMHAAASVAIKRANPLTPTPAKG